MAEYKLTLTSRDVTGKKLKSLRAEGLIPSVVYGGKEPILASSQYVETEKVLEKAGYHSPIDLEIDGKKKLAIVKDVQIDPVSRKIINIEFQGISAREVVSAVTPIVIVDFEASEASKTHHFAMIKALEEIEIKAKPADLPKELAINAAGLENVDDKLTLRDIVLPEGVAFADKEIDLEQVVVSLYDPAVEAEKREAEAAEAAEATEEESEAPTESTESAEDKTNEE